MGFRIPPGAPDPDPKPALKILPVTSPSTRASIGSRVADLEAGRYSDLAPATILERVVGIEEHRGIADLADVTPSASLTGER